MSDKDEALSIANRLTAASIETDELLRSAASELRTQHTRIKELEEANGNLERYLADSSQCVAALNVRIAELEAVARVALDEMHFMRMTADHAWYDTDYERVAAAIESLRKTLGEVIASR